MSKRVLITGGAGFIGSHVADRFLAEGYEVEIIDDLSTGNRGNVPAAATFHEMSVGSADAAKVVAAVRSTTWFIWLLRSTSEKAWRILCSMQRRISSER
jgi:UDP-glucose 4-epimerase